MSDTVNKIDLMIPRYKVIADWPESIFKIGEVLVCVVDGEEGNQYAFGDNQYYENLYPHLYPHLFKPLQWWEEREEKDMPEYVKQVKGDKVFKLLDSSQNGRLWHDDNEMELAHLLRHGNHYLPATLEEYNEYINNKK